MNTPHELCDEDIKADNAPAPIYVQYKECIAGPVSNTLTEKMVYNADSCEPGRYEWRKAVWKAGGMKKRHNSHDKFKSSML